MACIQVPLLIRYPEWIEPVLVVDKVVANIDIAPTLLNIAAGFLKSTGGDKIPLQEERGNQYPWRKEEAAGQARFPTFFFQKPADKQNKEDFGFTIL
ncbi:MAG: sulfatase/phosphatase domain-containing protein [Prolixibacteraceae bacterium]